VLGLSSAISAIVLGRRGDQVGHQRVLLACIVGSAFIYLPMALVGTPWQLVALQALFGIAAGGLIPSANAIIAGSTPAERRGAVFGMTASVGAIGAFVGPVVCAGIAASLGFQATFAFVAIVFFATAGALIHTLRGRSPMPVEQPSIAGSRAGQ
jgi:DHA1 family multidrug resistance protein-like MFS transporter